MSSSHFEFTGECAGHANYQLPFLCGTLESVAIGRGCNSISIEHLKIRWKRWNFPLDNIKNCEIFYKRQWGITSVNDVRPLCTCTFSTLTESTLLKCEMGQIIFIGQGFCFSRQHKLVLVTYGSNVIRVVLYRNYKTLFLYSLKRCNTL